MKKIDDGISLFVENQIRIAEIIQTSVNKNLCVDVNYPKVKMAQIGGPSIIGERISTEPIMDRFGNVVYIQSEGRVIKEIR